MKHMFSNKIAINIISILIFINVSVYSQDGATLFKRCSGCHSIGGGKMVGPDLKGITKKRNKEWLVKFIQSSKQLVSSGDADAKAIFEEYKKIQMPDNALTADQINQILAYIDAGNTGSVALTPEQLALQKRVDSLLKTFAAQDILYGKDLFNGDVRFLNGGPSCISCHNASYNNYNPGGILARDLTKSFSRLGGYAGIKGILSQPAFPAMAAAFKNKPLTDEEVAYLQLFLRSADNQIINQTMTKKTDLLLFGIIISALSAFIILALWHKRKHKSVNYEILKRQERYSI